MSSTLQSLFPTRLLVLLLAVLPIAAHAQEASVAAPRLQESSSAPTKSYSVGLPQLSKAADFKLYGIQNKQQLEFTLRQDQIVTSAVLNLAFTPSPALLSKLSHLRVYLNEELMGVIPVEETRLGQLQKQSLRLDPSLMTTFNRVQLEFVGHYADICEDLAHSSLWLDISKQTNIVIDQQSLPLANDLSYFPEPFLDMGDMQTQRLPFVFAGVPTMTQLRSASVLASYFGSKARWRKLAFPVSYDALPAGHAIVFAPNDDRPAFLRAYPEVDGPTIDMISAPDNPYQKLLLILGRNDEDVDIAVSALALGGPLFRGQSVRVEGVGQLSPRRPYDAPNWIPTDRPVLFSELKEYPGQLEVTGLRPPPITLNLNLPPDLFVWRNSGIPMQIRYRYTAPKVSDDSRLTLKLNGRFVDSYLLQPNDHKGSLARMRLSVLGNDAGGSAENLHIPALKIGARNQIQFDFAFASTVGSSQRDSCRTLTPIDSHAAIDEQSSIDFSGYMHYLEMPNLRAFSGGGFPFSRMADLSETVAVMPPQPTSLQASTLFEVLADVGSQVGYPALKLRVLDDLQEATQLDADIMWIGETPESFRSRPDANLLLEGTMTSLRRSRSEAASDGEAVRVGPALREEHDAVSQVSVSALAPIAAIVQLQSQRYPQRSMVGFLASTDEDFVLLRDALADSGKRDAMWGSVVVIRDSGVASALVGPRYFVGQLHWWQLVWYHLSDRPVLLAGTAVFGVLLTAFLLWSALRMVARRRLSKDA